MKHTPGIWRVVPSTHSSDPDPRSYVFADKNPNGLDSTLICKVEEKKNAPLIAVAPEMLAMLFSVRDTINHLEIDALGTAKNGEFEWPIRDELIDNITKLISKAKGE